MAKSNITNLRAESGGGGGQYDELVIPEFVIGGTYHKNDVVVFQNGVYRAKKDNPSTSSLTDWEELNVVNVVHILASPIT